MTDICKIYAPSWSEFSWECFRSISRAYTCSFFKPSHRSQRLYVATCELLPANILVWHILVLASSNACRIVQIESYATIHVYMWYNPRKRVVKKKKAGKDGVRTREWRMASWTSHVRLKAAALDHFATLPGKSLPPSSWEPIIFTNERLRPAPRPTNAYGTDFSPSVGTISSHLTHDSGWSHQCRVLTYLHWKALDVD